ncbi:hypothetical protein EYF80_037586 [Liparis tanakae]|uniref:Uncharacterized protein n=1 Tax=Liparis tanakae TaxID=230148 RepID=A0A4Z2GG14_9TELE|nr:hypothetical protein EYF80_037586 [Liparis tanakae]
MAATVPAAHIILRDNQLLVTSCHQRNNQNHRHTLNSPRLGAKAVPGQLEELEAQTQENRVLVPNGSHENTEEQTNGSACSQEMGKPQDVSLILSGSDSGTTKNTKAMSATAITVATSTTRLSPYCADR